MTQASKDALKNRIGDLRDTDSTNFSGGLELGLKWGGKVDVGKDMLVRVIMLTDGCANHGIISSEGLAQIVDTRGKTTVSCFGYGTDANQELLADLAKRGGGNYAFIKHPDEALSAFGKELGGLLSTYAQGIVLDLAPHNGHKIEEVLSDVDVEEKDDKVIIKLGDILSEEERHVVIAMKLSEQTQALPREMNVVDVKVDYDLIVDGKREHRQVELKGKLRFVKEGEEQGKPTQEVDQIVGLAQVGQAQVEAEELAKKGDFQGAVARMDAMEVSLNSRGHDKLGAFAKGIRSKVVSHASYASSQGYLRSSKGYSARGMSVSKMDGELEREARVVGAGRGVRDGERRAVQHGEQLRGCRERRRPEGQQRPRVDRRLDGDPRDPASFDLGGCCESREEGEAEEGRLEVQVEPLVSSTHDLLEGNMPSWLNRANPQNRSPCSTWTAPSQTSTRRCRRSSRSCAARARARKRTTQPSRRSPTSRHGVG